MHLQSHTSEPYPVPMTVSAHDVAVVLYERLPDLPTLKTHKLLYYCQAHHLATFGEPLFGDQISAWDHGPVVNDLWRQEKYGPVPEQTAPLNEAQLNTVGYVLSRYGGLTGRDLEVLSHNEMPWQRANESRLPGGSVRIEQAWMRDYFREGGASGRDDGGAVLDSVEVAEWLKDAEERLAEPLKQDSLEELRAMIADRA
jgi:uncharacterized phage-associated protein